MKPGDVAAFFRDAPVLLTDGGIETRLIYEYGCDLPEFASFLPLFRSDQRPALEQRWRRSPIAYSASRRRTSPPG